jgi:hypothetical protein
MEEDEESLIYATCRAGNARRISACTQLASEVTVLGLTSPNGTRFNNERRK